MRYLTLDDVSVSGLNVLVRSDLNVPLDSDGEIADDFRINSSLPTLERLVNMGARVEVCSHLGRPRGEDPKYSMEPIAEQLDEMTKMKVTFGRGSSGDIRVLENTRFHGGETDNAPAFSAPSVK